MARIQLIGRHNCHLCEAARRTVRSVCEDAIEWEEVDVDSSPDLQATYGELVPVVLVDGVQVGFWRIEAAAIRAALR